MKFNPTKFSTFLRWISVGIFVTITHFLLLNILENFFTYYPSFLGSTAIAMIISIYLNQRVVLGRKGLPFKFFFYLIIGYIIIAVLASWLYSMLRVLGSAQLLAFFVSVSVAASLQFFINYNIKHCKNW